MDIIAIDPGTRKLGWCHVRVCRGQVRMVDWGLFSSKKGDWLANAQYMRNMVNKMLKYSGGQIDLVLIEQPRHYSGGRGGAARNSDAILKLMYLVGVLSEVTSNYAIAVELVPVGIWKGQVPKRVTQLRLREHWGWEGFTKDDNVADAIGIADWYCRKQRKLKVIKLRH